MKDTCTRLIFNQFFFFKRYRVYLFKEHFPGGSERGGRGNRRIKGEREEERRDGGMKNRRGDSHPRNLDELAYRFGLTKPKLA